MSGCHLELAGEIAVLKWMVGWKASSDLEQVRTPLRGQSGGREARASGHPSNKAHPEFCWKRFLGHDAIVPACEQSLSRQLHPLGVVGPVQSMAPMHGAGLAAA